MMSLPAARYSRWMPAITSGRVRTSRSLSPLRSCEWFLKRSPRKSASVRSWRWIIVPIAPSRTRIRFASNPFNVFRTSGFIDRPLATKARKREEKEDGSWFGFVPSCFRSCICFCARCDEHRERIAGAACADADLHLRQTSRHQHSPQLVVVEAQHAIAQLRAYPVLRLSAQIEHEDPAARHGDARRIRHRARRVVRVVQRLREERDVDGRVLDRQLFELAALPDDVRHPAAPGEPARALENDLGSIHGD